MSHLRHRVTPVTLFKRDITYPRKRALASFIKHLKWSLMKQL